MKSSRHQSRFIAIQSLANYLFTNMDDSLETVLSIQHAQNIEHEYLKALYQNTLSSVDTLKPIISSIMKKNFEHLDYILKAILYLASYELLISKLDVGIVINEYVTLTKRFIDDLDYKLVHKVIHDLNQNKLIIDAGKVASEKSLASAIATASETITNPDSIHCATMQSAQQTSL